MAERRQRTSQQQPKPGRYFKVTRGSVDAFDQGRVVHEGEFREGTEFDRLIGLGVLEELNPAAGNPFDDDNRPDLATAVRSDSPPTLPYAPNVNASEEELRHAASSEDTFVTGPLSDGDELDTPQPETPVPATTDVVEPDRPLEAPATTDVTEPSSL